MRKVWAVVSFWSVVELRERICGASVGEFRAGGFVALWSVPGAERTAEGGSGEASVWGDSGSCKGVSRFHDRRARAGSRGRALRVFAALCLLAVVCGISRAEARTVTRILSRWRENDGSQAVTPHALSNPGAHSESFVIKIAPTECMRCDKLMTTKKDDEMKFF